MLQAVIYYIVTMILTKELVIATDQCTVYRFTSPFFPGMSCEHIYFHKYDQLCHFATFITFRYE